jgi:hypothetical protein
MHFVYYFTHTHIVKAFEDRTGYLGTSFLVDCSAKPPSHITVTRFQSRDTTPCSLCPNQSISTRLLIISWTSLYMSQAFVKGSKIFKCFKSIDCGARLSVVKFQALPFYNCVILGRLLNLSVPLFSHL